jgi:RNA polymerase II subunit A small phosphatase-like protein
MVGEIAASTAGLPDKPLLILDLDETLAHSAEHALNSPADFCFEGFFVYRRPFLSKFLNAVSQWFNLAVWSSASGPYVRTLVDRLLPNNALEFVWCRDRCTQRFDVDQQEHYWVKNLETVKRRGFRLERVLMIDDSSEKVAGHYGNLLLVQPFVGDLEDSELRDILPFLEWLRHRNNFRSVEKRRWRAFDPLSR